jgi:hypothetical protein
VGLEQGHVLVGGGVEDDLGAVAVHGLEDGLAVADVEQDLLHRPGTLAAVS